MLASLRNIDYPKDRIKIVFAVTHLGDKDSENFLNRLRKLVSAANMQCDIDIKVTYPKIDDMFRWGPYYAVIMNTHLMRLDFLEGDYTHFWLLGGDNPPTRRSLKQLLKLKADIASAVINQRRERVKQFKLDTEMAYPVYWKYIWTLDDLDVLALEPKLRNQLRTAWLEFMFLGGTSPQTEEKVLHNVVFGSGCSLVKRHVLEYIGYVLGSGGTHSEDLHFCSLANMRGFDTALGLEIRCAHFDSDGTVF